MEVERLAERSVVASQSELDTENAGFWDELCGTGLAQSIGITDRSADSLRRFDDAYLGIYPYLLKHVDPSGFRNQDVLEIGLGYGTLSQQLAQGGGRYFGLDISPGPVSMVRSRLRMLGQNREEFVAQGSALSIPHPEASFDGVVTIGCLHHTGNLPLAISEVHRVLRPGGRAVVMLYNRWSFRQLVQVPMARARAAFSNRGLTPAERVRAMYDVNSKGTAAPHTDYVSPREARHLFSAFSRVEVAPENFDAYSLLRGRLFIPRERLLNNVAKVLGLDLYITAIK